MAGFAGYQRTLLDDLQPMPAAAFPVEALGRQADMLPAPAAGPLPLSQRMPQTMGAQTIGYQRPAPPSDIQNQNLGMEILKQYVGNKDTQSQQSGMLQQILSKRFEPTQDDMWQSNLQNTQAAIFPEAYKMTSPQALAKDRYELELAPYTLMSKFKESQNSGGATGVLVDRLMTENPGMTFQQALYQVQTGFRQGLQYDAQGNVIATPGVAGAKGAIKYGEQAGKNQADLEFAGPTAAATATGKIGGETLGKASADLPRVVQNANYAVQKIRELRNHPDLDAVVGVRGMVPIIPGTGGADALARFKQITGQNFLQAYETLKGGGQITEVEGQKATEAIARLDRAQDKPTIQRAMDDLISVIETGTQRAQSMAGQAPNYSASPNAAPPQGGGWSIKRIQ